VYDALTTPELLRQWMKLDATADDGLLTSLIAVASDTIGRFCDRANLGAVYSYTSENYFKRWTTTIGNGEFDLVLRHYPVVSLSQVLMNGSNVIPILNASTLISGAAGVYLMIEDEEPRKLKFRNLWRDNTVPIQVTYTAGYANTAIPSTLQQAANMFAAEIYKSQSWIGVRSKSIAGENISYELGGSYGMSNRIKNMLMNFKNVVPWKGG
jgi:hypothetical protein